MPDKFGRGTDRERRSAALLRLSFWADDDPDTVENPSGLALAIRGCRMLNLTDLEIANLLNWGTLELSDFMEEHSEPI
jgi:hypothetical protein